MCEPFNTWNLGCFKDHLLFKLIFLISPPLPVPSFYSFLYRFNLCLLPSYVLPLSFCRSFTMSTNIILEKDYKHSVALFSESCNEKLITPGWWWIWELYFNMITSKWKQLETMKDKTHSKILRFRITFILNKRLLTILLLYL